MKYDYVAWIIFGLAYSYALIFMVWGKVIEHGYRSINAILDSHSEWTGWQIRNNLDYWIDRAEGNNPRNAVKDMWHSYLIFRESRYNEIEF